MTKTIDGGQTWEKESAPAPEDVRFEAIASSADGSKFVVVGQHQNIWLFEEGATPEWTEVGGLKKKWTTVASSADGTVLVAGVQNGNLWTSSNSGRDWVEVKNTGSTKSWTSSAASADGSTMIAAVHYGNLWISNNSGANWTEIKLTTGWVGVATSSDGAKLVAIDEGANGNVWTSSDSGQTWEERDITGVGSSNLKEVASSSDGNKIMGHT